MAVYNIEGCQWNCYPDSTVLINKMDIHDQSELDAVEKQITLLRGIQAEKETEFVNVDFSFYCSLHRFLFGDLYDWAGALRTINISKKGTVFCKHTELAEIGRLKFERLKAQNYLLGMSDDEFITELADLRLFVALLVRNTDRSIDFARCDSDMLNIATIRAAQGDISMLRDVLEEMIE